MTAIRMEALLALAGQTAYSHNIRRFRTWSNNPGTRKTGELALIFG